MTEETTKPETIHIQGTLHEYTKQVAEAAIQGYIVSDDNNHYPRMVMHGVHWCVMTLPVKPVEEVTNVPKEPTAQQIRKEELVAALDEKVNLEDQVGAATPAEVPKRTGRPARK